MVGVRTLPKNPSTRNSQRYCCRVIVFKFNQIREVWPQPARVPDKPGVFGSATLEDIQRAGKKRPYDQRRQGRQVATGKFFGRMVAFRGAHFAATVMIETRPTRPEAGSESRPERAGNGSAEHSVKALRRTYVGRWPCCQTFVGQPPAPLGESETMVAHAERALRLELRLRCPLVATRPGSSAGLTPWYRSSPLGARAVVGRVGSSNLS